MISIIIPARNEEAVIGRTLKEFTNGAAANELDVIVVCNGCFDRTATVALQCGSPVRVIETEIAGKCNALNIGDRAAGSFPRIYVDADVTLTIDAIRALASRLSRGDVLAVAPRAHVETNGCSWAVRRYYDIRSRLPSAEQGIGGSGVYALSEAGRKRFADFPNVTADDGFVRMNFTAEERGTLSDVYSTVFAPRTIQNLIALRTRAYFGTRELRSSYPDLWKNADEPNHRSLLKLFRDPSLWLKLSIYVAVNLIARYRARANMRSRKRNWERDETSRTINSMTPNIPAGSGT